MFRLRIAAVTCGLLVAACRIEDHTPTGSRNDDEAIQHVLVEYTRGLSARDWPCVRELFWSEAVYAVALPTRNLVLPIDSARQRLLPPGQAGDGFGAGAQRGGEQVDEVRQRPLDLLPLAACRRSLRRGEHVPGERGGHRRHQHPGHPAHEQPGADRDAPDRERTQAE